MRFDLGGLTLLRHAEHRFHLAVQSSARMMMPLPATPAPNFQDPEFLRAHAEDIFRFYEYRCIDPEGGFYHCYRDDGAIYDAETRHLVSSTRFVFNFARAARAFGRPALLDGVHHGLAYLQQAHRNKDSGGYAWLRNRDAVIDDTNHCYGLAFVLLAYSEALLAGATEAEAGIEDTVALMAKYFWQEDAQLYADEADGQWLLSPYRGQNANMHACEAFLAAHSATGEDAYLQRARLLAHRFSQDLLEPQSGWIWEHYDATWRIDWEYNKDDPKHLFRPWGFQPGHQTEWAKLLCHLYRQCGEEWMLNSARRLFDSATAAAWDETHGGLVYGLAPDGTVCDSDKYYWVQAESFAAAAHLAVITGEPHYWQWYDKIWHYAWQHFVDHRHGAWFRILTQDNQPYSDEKSPPGKTDYHTLGATLEVYALLQASPVGG